MSLEAEIRRLVKQLLEFLLLVSSMHATCLSCVDHSRALKYTTIQLEMEYIYMQFICLLETSMSFILMSEYRLHYRNM